MKSLIVSVLATSICLTLTFGSADVSASEGIVHDPEFVRMEKEFGKQWKADEEQVRKKLAALEAKFGRANTKSGQTCSTRPPITELLFRG